MTATLYGHRDFVQTSCPGNRYREWVPQLRELNGEDEMSDLDANVTLPAKRHESTDYNVVYEQPEKTATARQWLQINRNGWTYAIFAARVYKAANRAVIDALAAKVADLDVTALRADLDALDAIVEGLDDVIVRPGEG